MFKSFVFFNVTSLRIITKGHTVVFGLLLLILGEDDFLCVWLF